MLSEGQVIGAGLACRGCLISACCWPYYSANRRFSGDPDRWMEMCRNLDPLGRSSVAGMHEVDINHYRMDYSLPIAAHCWDESGSWAGAAIASRRLVKPD